MKNIKAAEKHNDAGFRSFFRTGWKRFYLKWYDDPVPSAQVLCPRATDLVNRVPGLNAAMYAADKSDRKGWAPSGPFDQALESANRPGQNRLAI